MNTARKSPSPELARARGARTCPKIALAVTAALYGAAALQAHLGNAVTFTINVSQFSS